MGLSRQVGWSICVTNMKAIHIQKLYKDIFKKPLQFKPATPAEYRNELFGVEYLYAQSGVAFSPKHETEIDEGIDDMDELPQRSILQESAHSEDLSTIAAPLDR